MLDAVTKSKLGIPDHIRSARVRMRVITSRYLQDTRNFNVTVDRSLGVPDAVASSIRPIGKVCADGVQIEGGV